jgi:hypothetical protein
MVNFEQCIDWCESGVLDLKIITCHTRENIRDAKRLHELYIARMKDYKDKNQWEKLRLAPKNTIQNWTNEIIIIKLMNKNVWSYNIAQRWFTDFMQWLYTSMRLIAEGKNTYTIPMISIALDDVFHTYLENSLDYFAMCQDLFNLEYIPHSPGPRVMENDQQLHKLMQDVKNGMIELQNDWGREYIDRVFAYEMDIVKLDLGKNVTIEQCIDLCDEKAFDYRLFGSSNGQMVKLGHTQLYSYYKNIEQISQKLNLSQLTLPPKTLIEQWEHRQVILKLMNTHTWNEDKARECLIDYMKWLYTAMRLTQIKQKYTLPILPFILNFVWLDYLQFSYDFFTMSHSLFGIEYVHKINQLELMQATNCDSKIVYDYIREGLLALNQDWGSTYVNRIFAYEINCVKIKLEIAN